MFFHLDCLWTMYSNVPQFSVEPLNAKVIKLYVNVMVFCSYVIEFAPKVPKNLPRNLYSNLIIPI